jgi:hypothetical protein
MSSAAPSPAPGAAPSPAGLARWRFVLAPRWLAWHAFAVLAVIGMLWLGDWQFRRALGGNALSWAYTFEWPVFAVFGVVFWAKTILDEAKPKTDADELAVSAAAAADGGEPGLPGTAGRRAAGDDEPEADPDLDQYNAYLDRLSRQDQDEAAGRGPGPR